MKSKQKFYTYLTYIGAGDLGYIASLGRPLRVFDSNQSTRLGTATLLEAFPVIVSNSV
jgi:hypothetical protein